MRDVVVVVVGDKIIRYAQIFENLARKFTSRAIYRRVVPATLTGFPWILSMIMHLKNE